METINAFFTISHKGVASTLVLRSEYDKENYSQSFDNFLERTQKSFSRHNYQYDTVVFGSEILARIVHEKLSSIGFIEGPTE